MSMDLTNLFKGFGDALARCIGDLNVDPIDKVQIIAEAKVDVWKLKRSVPSLKMEITVVS
jgi:hypothetical protein